MWIKKSLKCFALYLWWNQDLQMESIVQGAISPSCWVEPSFVVFERSRTDAHMRFHDGSHTRPTQRNDLKYIPTKRSIVPKKSNLRNQHIVTEHRYWEEYRETTFDLSRNRANRISRLRRIKTSCQARRSQLHYYLRIFENDFCVVSLDSRDV
jgi:hypothetical protein